MKSSQVGSSGGARSLKVKRSDIYGRPPFDPKPKPGRIIERKKGSIAISRKKGK